MRQIIIDTETTGLDPKLGHRVIEVAALEVANRRATGRTVHLRLDPEREIDGRDRSARMTWDDLKGKPRFEDVAAEFVASRRARNGSSITLRSISGFSTPSSRASRFPRARTSTPA
jgi:hypothetical protein